MGWDWGSAPGGAKAGNPSDRSPLDINSGGTDAGKAPGRAHSQRPAPSKPKAPTSTKGQKLAARNAGQALGWGNSPLRLRRQSSRQRKRRSAATANKSPPRTNQGLR